MSVREPDGTWCSSCLSRRNGNTYYPHRWCIPSCHIGRSATARRKPSR
ncbi:MAG: zinc-finger domain-containing protein [Bacteroidaceae bacterium]|nr:zinc-finger domain-containing protein [Bacteroidaceae bacterium]